MRVRQIEQSFRNKKTISFSQLTNKICNISLWCTCHQDYTFKISGSVLVAESLTPYNSVTRCSSNTKIIMQISGKFKPSFLYTSISAIKTTHVTNSVFKCNNNVIILRSPNLKWFARCYTSIISEVLVFPWKQCYGP